MKLSSQFKIGSKKQIMLPGGIMTVTVVDRNEEMEVIGIVPWGFEKEETHTRWYNPNSFVGYTPVA
jgi:hypothetical protein